MPKSKRDKKVSLTQVKKKPLETKQQLVLDVQSCAEQYARLFVISTENERNSKLKDIRQEWKHSRFFFGKNKVMALALGKSESEECQNNIHLISKHLINQRGLLFTNKTKDEVLKWFSNYKEPDYARSGNIALETITLDKGPLPTLSFAMEPQLRQLGLPTSLQKGIITLTKDYELCKKGEPLTPEQARLLKLLGNMMSEFKVNVICMWSNDGTFELINTKSQNEDEENLKMEDSDDENKDA